MITTATHDTPENVEAALSKLGLTVELLVEAVKMGYVERSKCTPFDAPIFPALTQWNSTLRVLREKTALIGWSALDDNNYSRTVNPDGTMAIAVASGCLNTGNPGFLPTTKSTKGPNTLNAITANAAQFNFMDKLLGNPSPNETVAPKEDSMMTWILLFSVGEKEIKAELSLPASMSIDGRPDTWKERIMLPSIPLDPITPEIKPDFGPDLDVTVKRRTA